MQDSIRGMQGLYQKNPIFYQKSPIFYQKSYMFCQQGASNHAGLSSWNTGPIPKEPYIVPKEPYILPKEPYVLPARRKACKTLFVEHRAFLAKPSHLAGNRKGSQEALVIEYWALLVEYRSFVKG